MHKHKAELLDMTLEAVQEGFNANQERIDKLVEEVEAYKKIGTVEEFKYLKLKEHNYDNCHNYTCRRKCKKDGYNDAIDELAKALKEELGNYDFWKYDIIMDGELEEKDVPYDWIIDNIVKKMKGRDDNG